MKTKKEYYDLAIIVVVIFFLDRLTKLLVINNIALNESIEVTNFFSLTYWTNTGIAFGFFQNANIVLTLVTIVVIGVICYYFKYLTKTKLSTVATSLILGGAFGILIVASASEQRTANQFFPFLIFPQLFLSGVFSPVQDFPTILYYLSYLTPIRYVVDLMRSLYYAGTPEYDAVIANSPVFNIFIILLLLVTFLIAGTLLFIRKEKNR